MSAEQQGVGDENMYKLREVYSQVEAVHPILPSLTTQLIISHHYDDCCDKTGDNPGCHFDPLAFFTSEAAF